MPLEVYELKDFNGSGLSQWLAGNICAFEECRRLFIWSIFPKENMKSLSDSSFAGTLRDMLCEFGAFFPHSARLWLLTLVPFPRVLSSCCFSLQHCRILRVFAIDPGLC